MKTTKYLVFAAFCLLVGAAACGGATRGEARVVVMPIAGSDAANDAVTDVVSSRYELISPRQYSKTAKKLKAKSRKERDIRKVSRKLDIDALVSGEFVKRGKRKYELRLTMHAGQSGEEFNSVTIKLRSKRLRSRDRRKIKKKLYAALAEVDTWQVDEGDDSRSSRGRNTRVSSRSGDSERERARRIRKKQQDDDERREDKRLAKAERREMEREERRAEKESKRRRKEERRSRRDRDDEDEDEDEDDDKEERRSKKSKSSKDKKDRDKKAREAKREREAEEARELAREERRAEKERKRKKKEDEKYEVVTKRDKAGQAIDNEDPF